MGQPEGKPPHAGQRLTREDVERLIDEHGGPEGLDLREANLLQADLTWLNLRGTILELANLEAGHLSDANLQEANLSRAQLQGANLSLANLEGANLIVANLQGANLLWASLQGADLWGANLQRASLSAANLQGADLQAANLQRARLADAKLRDANLEGANWGDYVLGEEMAREFGAAASAYRALKQWHTEAGMYDIAGQFHYREMEARRKLAWQERRLPYAVATYVLRFLYGYGERPERVIGWVAAVIFGLAFVYLLPGVLTGGFWSALYYSAVSFTALGYGGWAPEPQGWAGRFLGAGESFIGVFMMALFLVTFTRKMTR
jgi:hypothetical protein